MSSSKIALALRRSPGLTKKRSKNFFVLSRSLLLLFHNLLPPGQASKVTFSSPAFLADFDEPALASM